MLLFSTSADCGILSQLLSTSMMRMNAPVGSHIGDQAIRRTDIILSLDILRVYPEPAGSLQWWDEDEKGCMITKKVLLSYVSRLMSLVGSCLQTYVSGR